MGIIEIKIRKNLEFWFNLKVVKGQVILTSIIMAFVCLLFTGCKKADDGTDVKEDLSYLIQTYNRYNQNGFTYKTTRTFDGYKETGYQHYVNGQLYQERKNYLYNGLKASWDTYTYQIDAYNDEAWHSHSECEYLDYTFQREKFKKTEYYYEDSQKNYTTEAYSEYDGKKKISYKSYSRGVLTVENHDYIYDGLHCTYRATDYSSSGNVSQKRSYIIEYLDDTYLRQKTRTFTRVYYSNGQPGVSRTHYLVYDYDGKKIIGTHDYYNGELSSVSRDYQYDGLTCCFYSDTYQNGEVISTSLHEVEYLE